MAYIDDQNLWRDIPNHALHHGWKAILKSKIG
jgi:hypothetical protein